ncbi:SCP-2 sterol transfer family protein [Krasilnikovia cinnamomea]|uniref:SCP-2 sterol transfer family protein n=1 Tax=Krasilnikovia cinnamomea TaxID=349313 RepID=A0A4Q7ZH55_9ACTN|nr:SCP2 sterol-binding domain-containing protein [Krasilnikovia cinnamomea]RZU49399.1 SCP-2 sterol transfer family protein [Krasilnikovia cinnamomea]
MADPISDFFEDLSQRKHDPRLSHVTATVRFDIVDGRQTDSWRLVVRDGQLEVEPGDGAADATVTAERTVFEGLVSGTVNAMAALLRGELLLEGNANLIVSVQRLFPGPPGGRSPRTIPAKAGASS